MSVVDLRGTVVTAVDEEILNGPINMIRDWFRARRSGGDGGQVPQNEIKVVFLVDGSAGKTYTIARLLNDCGELLNYTDKVTPGISIRNMVCSIDGDQVQIHFWDFCG